MQTGREREQGLWQRIRGRVRWVLEELKEDSVAQNPEKPIDCCNPLVYRRKSSKR